MDKIIINEENLRPEDYINEGFEGFVCKYNDNGRMVAIKIFFERDKIMSKTDKIYQLEKMKNKNSLLTLPEKFLVEDGEIVGYSMPYINIKKESGDFYLAKRKQKIDFLENVKKIVLLLNSNNAKYFDYCNDNVVVDEKNKMHLVDLDNISINGIEFDKINYVHNLIKKRKITNTTEYNKFAFNMFCAAILSSRDDSGIINDINSGIIALTKMPKEAKEIMTYSLTAEKQYKTGYLIDAYKK